MLIRTFSHVSFKIIMLLDLVYLEKNLLRVVELFFWFSKRTIVVHGTTISETTFNDALNVFPKFYLSLQKIAFWNGNVQYMYTKHRNVVLKEK